MKSQININELPVCLRILVYFDLIRSKISDKFAQK